MICAQKIVVQSNVTKYITEVY